MKGALLCGSMLILAMTGLVACGSSGGGGDGKVDGNDYMGTCRAAGSDGECTDFYIEANAVAGESQVRDAVKKACSDSNGSYGTNKCDTSKYPGGCKFTTAIYSNVVFTTTMTKEACQGSGTWVPGTGQVVDGDQTTDVDGDETTDEDGDQATEEDGDQNTDEVKGDVVGSCDYSGMFCSEFYSVSFTAATAKQVCDSLSATFVTSGCDRSKCYGGCIMPGGQQVIWYLKTDSGSLEQSKSMCDYTWVNP